MGYRELGKRRRCGFRLGTLGDTGLTNQKIAIAACAALFAMRLASAHHSFVTHYDPSRSMELEGVVAEFSFRSPHSFIFVDTTDSNGEVTNWEIELHSVPVLSRMGFRPDTFKPGDRITVNAWPNRSPDNPLVFGIGVITADGTPLGESPPIRDVDSMFTSASGVQRLQGRWQVPIPEDPATFESPMPLTAAGLAAVRDYDPQRSPANYCEPYNVPAAYHTPYVFDIRLEERQAIVYHEAYDITRTIPLGSVPAAVEPTGVFGIAVGSIDGDELVIESSGYRPSAWGLATAVDQNGVGADIPSSSEKSVVERFAVSADGMKLTVRYTLEDPVYLTGPYSSFAVLDRVDDDAPMYPFECELDSAARFSRDP